VGRPFTLASWNLFQGLHHSTRRTAQVDNDKVPRHLQSLDADVLVLPEAWRYQNVHATWAEDIAEQLGYDLHQWISDSPSRARDTVPWRMVMLTRIPARAVAPQVMSSYGSFGPRAIVRVELAESGLTIAAAHLYGIHLLAQRQPRNWMNERAALRLASRTNDVIAGDLNMWGPVVRRDTSPMTPAAKGRTFPSPRPHSQIDHVLVNSRVRVLDSEVLPDMGSDHRAIRTTLQAR